MNHPSVPSQNWTNNLCNCCSDTQLCCQTFCCPCVTYGQLKEKLNGKPDVGCCSCHCWIFLFSLSIPFISVLLFTATRGDVRLKLNIEGSCCGDLCASFWCGICSLIQATSEVDKRGTGFHEFN